MGTIKYKFSPFFRNVVLFVPDDKGEKSARIGQLSIVRPNQFIVDESERKIYGYDAVNDKATNIKVAKSTYYIDIIYKLDRMRKICAASAKLGQDNKDRHYHSWPTFHFYDLCNVDEKYLVECLHDDDNLVFAMANGLYNLIGMTFECSFLLYENRN